MSNITIKDFYELRKYSGDLGIEIEVEGRNLPITHVGWRREHDGSLRGNENAEYVTKAGLLSKNVDKTIDTLKEAFDKSGGIIDKSNRAGVHVHVNVQDLTHSQVVTFAAIYYIFERLLLKFSGKYREGNLFCLGFNDADYIFEMLGGAIAQNNFYSLASDNLRYAALNWKPVTTYGSLEFRSMRTPQNFDLVKRWAKMLLKLKETSLKYNNVIDVISEFSMNTPEDFLHKHFEEYSGYLICENMEHMMYEGMYNAQDLVFLADWNNFEASISGMFKDRGDNVKVDFKQVEDISWHQAPAAPQPIPLARIHKGRYIRKPVKKADIDEDMANRVKAIDF